MDIADPIPFLGGSSLLLLGFLGSLLLSIAIISFLLFLSALISGSEVAYFSLTPNDIEELEQENSTSSKRVLSLKESPSYLLATILIANNLVNIAIVLLSDFFLKKIFPDSLFDYWAAQLQASITWLGYLDTNILSSLMGFAITVIGVTFLLVLFGEVAPKIYARYNRVALARTVASPLQFFLRLTQPLAFLLVEGTAVIERKLASRSLDFSSASREEIDSAIELTVNSGEEGEHSKQNIDILKRIVKFSDVTVRQIMRARMDITAVDQKINYHELLTVVRESGYSRIPVYDEDLDKVQGILYAKDLLGYLQETADFDWSSLVRRDVLFIPESKKISDLLREFQQDKMHMAIVIDEYGGSEGLVTLEDIMEEVIGELHDEFDDEEEILYQKIDDFNFIFEGKTLLNDVCRIVQIPTETFDDVKGEYESFAGLLLEMRGGFPQAEEEISFPPYRFKVISLSNRRVKEILITLPEQKEVK